MGHARSSAFEAVREDVTEHVREDLQRGSVFYDLHHGQPYRLDVFAASIKDGRGNQLHRRLFVVQANPSPVGTGEGGAAAPGEG